MFSVGDYVLSKTNLKTKTQTTYRGQGFLVLRVEEDYLWQNEFILTLMDETGRITERLDFLFAPATTINWIWLKADV